MANGATVIVNSLYATKDPAFLTQDLVLIKLANGLHIDISWFPEHDPQGSYHVTVLRDGEPIHEVNERSAAQAAMIAQGLAKQYH